MLVNKYSFEITSTMKVKVHFYYYFILVDFNIKIIKAKLNKFMCNFKIQFIPYIGFTIAIDFYSLHNFFIIGLLIHATIDKKTSKNT